ncbi:MAG: RnfABCDGE type electron transport complex subunit D [Lachnospiraceae bacterium]|uniref:Ion-translocating oxidoreductase complex subunit D n=1 Tax=Candidatus Weimeria bifida TaxID=2599074 RepID=A0A6N7IZF8_9FIRM|nr:RnfABCDGE type electron transport complex subunit D [Candidatus Weimeria bifida]RRF97020.1 MAG: RnfABCDGE type electron transport complex subunit D [Lachnospiraceae bacterium]
MEEKKVLNVTASPHVRANVDTQKIMACVIIALLPATVFGIFNFGIRALIIIVASVAAAVLSEYIYCKIVHRKNTTRDLSAVVTGLLLALNLPSSVPIWLPILGSAFAIIIVKELFGGLGQNFMNPALGARCFLLISFAGLMTDYSNYPGFNDKNAFSGATPLASLKAGRTVDTMRMILGNIPGTIGETSMIAIVIGAIFLILMGVISLRIPGTYILTFAIFTIIFGGHGFDMNFLVGELAGGGLMLGAFFMATDYVTSPITPTGQIIYGILLGVMTGIFRFFGSSAEGVSYAIIFSNLFVPLIEKATIPRAFGIRKPKKAKKEAA